MNQLLTVRDLQKKLQIGRNAAYSLIKQPGFPSVVISNQYRVEEDALAEWLMENRCKR